MKIKSIEYCNFRNFKKQGKIYFSTDGKVTVIYGKNGDGKTTLHQLFQWILYNEVHFNKTASDKMYNLQFEREVSCDQPFSVWGQIDFEHKGEIYCVRREYIYKKELLQSVKEKEVFSIRKKIDNDWGEKLDNKKAQEFIDSLLPPGLSEYFFFDGESMIADLNQLGINSAEKLRTSLFRIFDLDKYKQAIDHIGSTELKTTVLGALFKGLGGSSGSAIVDSLKIELDGLQTSIEAIKQEIEKQEGLKEGFNNSILSLSEKIGSRRSMEVLEAERKEQIEQRDKYLAEMDEKIAEFGETLYEQFPKALLHKKMEDARVVLQMKIDKQELTPGINRILLDSILNNSDAKCICGRPLYHEQIDRLNAYYRLLPPDSYKSMYDNFKTMVQMWGKDFNPEKVEKVIRQVINKLEDAKKCDREIAKIVEEEKSSSADIEKMVRERQANELSLRDCDSIITEKQANLKIYNKALNKKMKAYQKEAEKSADYIKYATRIDIMERVREYFEEILKEKSDQYSKTLEIEIQSLINTMLTSQRKVAVSSDFLLKVSDSYNDESKSEGQFAIVSFAYIGGILRMLSKDDTLANKEYPLVLDGPFSKLDPDQRQNVIDTIPVFAPQVIVFSKDDLTDCFENSPGTIGRIWTIHSNEEKNVATVEEGYQWTR